MRIGVIGGVEKMETRLRQVAALGGHEVEFHAGHTSGPGADRLRALIERCDLVVIVTDVNSHGAVLKARDLARRAGRVVRFERKFGTSRLRALLN